MYCFVFCYIAVCIVSCFVTLQCVLFRVLLHCSVYCVVFCYIAVCIVSCFVTLQCVLCRVLLHCSVYCVVFCCIAVWSTMGHSPRVRQCCNDWPPGGACDYWEHSVCIKAQEGHIFPPAKWTYNVRYVFKWRLFLHYYASTYTFYSFHCIMTLVYFYVICTTVSLKLFCYLLFCYGRPVQNSGCETCN